MENAETRHPKTSILWTYLLAFFAAWTVARLSLVAMGFGVGNSWLDGLAKILIWIVPVILYLSLVKRESPLCYLKLNVLPKAFPPVVWLIFLVVAFAGGSSILLGQHRFPVQTIEWVNWIVETVLISAVAEEIVFRGFILQTLMARLGFERANLLTAVLFVLIHVPIWVLVQGWGPAEFAGHLSNVVYIGVIGWMFGYVFDRTKSLWTAILLHALNNVLAP